MVQRLTRKQKRKIFDAMHRPGRLIYELAHGARRGRDNPHPVVREHVEEVCGMQEELLKKLPIEKKESG